MHILEYSKGYTYKHANIIKKIVFSLQLNNVLNSFIIQNTQSVFVRLQVLLMHARYNKESYVNRWLRSGELCKLDYVQESCVNLVTFKRAVGNY